MKTHNPTYVQQAHIFKALMHPTRIAILEALRDGEQCVCHLEAYLTLPQAYLSQQLAVLRKAKLITDRHDGLNIFYELKSSAVLDLLNTARIMLGSPIQASSQAVACPCPKCAIHTDRPHVIIANS